MTRDGHVERDVAHDDRDPDVDLLAQPGDRAEVLPPGERHAVEDHRAAATEVVAGGVEHRRDGDLALGGRVVAGPEEGVANDVLVEHAGVGEPRRERTGQRALARPGQAGQHDHPARLMSPLPAAVAMAPPYGPPVAWPA